MSDLATQGAVTTPDVKCPVTMDRHLPEKKSPVVLVMVVLRHYPSLAVVTGIAETRVASLVTADVQASAHGIENRERP